MSEMNFREPLKIISKQIESSTEIEPGVYFDIDKYRHYFEKGCDRKMNRILGIIASRVNKDLPNSILPNGQINMKSFVGEYSEEMEEIVNDCEESFYGFKKEESRKGAHDGVRDFFVSRMREAMGLSSEDIKYTDEQIIKIRKEDRENSDPCVRWEKASVVLLSRILGDKFLVVRSSDFDDYTHGTDIVIVDKESGAVICAIDLVNDEVGGNRYKEKMDKLKKDIKAGQGGELSFGITVEKDEKSEEKKLVRKRLENIPKFFLPVEKKDLENLLKNIPNDFNASITEIEKIIFGKLVNSLEWQENSYLSSVKENAENFKTNLKNSKELLRKMKEIKDKF